MELENIKTARRLKTKRLSSSPYENLFILMDLKALPFKIRNYYVVVGRKLRIFTIAGFSFI